MISIGNEENAQIYLQNVVENLRFEFNYPPWHTGCKAERYYNLDKELVVSVCKFPRCPQQVLMIKDYPRSLFKQNDGGIIELLKKHKVYCEIHSVAKLRLQVDTVCVFCDIEEEILV